MSDVRLQTLLFSATFPKEIQSIAQEFLHDYYHLEIGQVGVTGSNINQFVINPSLISKMAHLKAILKLPGKMLIFCNQKVSVQQLTESLRREVDNQTIDKVPEEIQAEISALIEGSQQMAS